MRHPLAFVLAVLVILGWVATGPFFGFSDTWQLVINTGTTIVTFLMVFLMQNTQNRESAAVQPISHRKVMIIDGETVITRSFNFTKATRERNTERLPIFRDLGLAKQYTRNWETHQQHWQP
jgi:phosphatidylserine/phosphatidylglycerophosphate/cardiolipin synthase-like enzyme